MDRYNSVTCSDNTGYIFNTHVECGGNICNKCRVKTSRMKSKRLSGGLSDIGFGDLPEKLPRYITKRDLSKAARIKNFLKEKQATKIQLLEVICFTDFTNLPGVLEIIILNLPVKDILSLASTCHSLNNFMTRQIWQKLILKDFNVTTIPHESICQNVHAALNKHNKEHQIYKINLTVKLLI